MSETIKDGRGSGKLAGVNGYNRLDVSSVVLNIEHFLSVKERSVFIVCAGDKPFPTGFPQEYHILYVKNTDPVKNMHVEDLRGTWDGGQGGSGTLFIRVCADPSAPVSGTLSGVRPQCSNVGTGVAPNMDYATWDKILSGGMVLSSTGTAMFSTRVAQGYTSFGGNTYGLVLEPGHSLLFTARPDSPGSGSVGFAVYFYDPSNL